MWPFITQEPASVIVYIISLTSVYKTLQDDT